VDVVASVPRASARTNAAGRSRFAVLPVYWHLLSLDAPTVAVLWAWSLAHAVRVHPSAITLAVLGIGTWLIYVADRLLDGRGTTRKGELRERHFFHARHARALLMAGVAASAALLFFITRMPAADRRADACIFAGVVVYSALVHQRLVRIRFPRELVVGVVFACACAVPAWPAAGDLHSGLAALTAVFAALCFLNCSAIHAWERPTQQRWSRVTLLALCVAIAAIGVSFTMRTIEGVRLGVALLASALLLLALDRDQRRASRKADAALSPLALRILADATLLTPLLLLVPWKL
jgi:hypothetical protein